MGCYCRALIRLVVSFCALTAASAGLAMDPRFELDPATIGRAQAKETVPTPKKTAAIDGMARYTVRSGDTIRLILRREFGVPESRLEAMTRRVLSVNGVDDIRKLKVGTSLRIPLAEGRNPGGRLSGAGRAGTKRTVQRPHGQALRLHHPVGGVADPVTPLQQIWPRLVPDAEAGETANLNLVNDRYTLSLDAARYPVLPASDGGRIVLDTAGTLPSLVRTLATEQDQVRFVSEDPADRHRFVGALLAAAGFYSVEENFSLTVGTDPRLRIFADFKIERTPESLLQRDVALLNLSETGVAQPLVLREFLRQEGFQLLEPYAAAEGKPTTEQRGSLHLLIRQDAVSVTDVLLSAMDLAVSRNRSVELFNLQQHGVQLNIAADRLFEDAGNRYVITFFDGNPVNYTLSRLLETRGYRVIVVDLKDDLLKASQRILARLDGGESLGLQTLQLLPGARYAVQLNGVALGRKFTRGKQVILTTSPLSPLLRELAAYNGFSVVE